MIGLLNQPVHFCAENSLEIIAIRCYPWAVFNLLGLQSNTNGVHNLEHPVASLHSTLKEFINAGKIEDAIDLVKLHFLNTPQTTDIILAKAGTAMTNANGSLAVSEIANAAHATVRTLERKFRQSSGHTVKDVSGLMRFEQARNKLWHDPKTSLAALAYELGYTDQSHFSREFKRYSSTTPAAFARNAKKGQQDVSNNFITFVS
jgi:AraC-like DNA-binding protein